MELLIGDKNLSSWSMRPWLALKRAGAEFTERVIRLNQPSTPAELASATPAGLVPALIDGELRLWDSLAISEWAAERWPQAGLWPADPTRRALARAAAAEMHSGFRSLRGECPMNLRLREHKTLTPITQADVRRVVRLWTELRRRAEDGPFLLGRWSIADAFYTPVATRFRTYGVLLSDYGDDGTAGAYAEALLREPEFLEWEQAALAEAA
ncbi:MAG: glutathione S-transferase family protein [Pseudomonadota bacterium]|nr:glutathione S-transferase family protein [Pseudomonadota bacterium]